MVTRGCDEAAEFPSVDVPFGQVVPTGDPVLSWAVKCDLLGVMHRYGFFVRLVLVLDKANGKTGNFALEGR